MQGMFVAGCQQPVLCGEEPYQHYNSDPHKEEKMAEISTVVATCSQVLPVFYEDEVDIHLNPKTGADWKLHGQQKRLATPGQNEKYYLAGTLHSGTGRVSYVGGNSKSSALFISLLKHLKESYRMAKTIKTHRG